MYTTMTITQAMQEEVNIQVNQAAAASAKAKTITLEQTQAMVDENYALSLENELARKGIANNTDEVIIHVLKGHIKSNDIRINANRVIMAYHPTVMPK